MAADISDDGIYVLGNDNQRHGPIDIGTLDSWLCDDRISLDSLTWSPGENAKWIPLRLRAERRADAQQPAAHTTRERELLGQLERFMQRRGYTVAAFHAGVNSTITAAMATAGAVGLKLALKYLAGVAVSVPSASGNSASKATVQDAVSPLLRVTDVCGLNYGLLQLHPASGMVAFFADTLANVDVLWRLDVCVRAALRLKEFAVGANGQNGFFMRPIILCSSSEGYRRHARIMPRAGFVQCGDNRGSVGSRVSLVDLSQNLVLFQQQPGLFGKLSGMLEKPFGPTDLNEVLSL